MKREAAVDREASRRETSAGLRASVGQDICKGLVLSAFFFWMESAEHELLRSAGLHVFERHPDGSEFSWPRVSVSCDYRSALRFGEEVDITVYVAELGRSSVTYRFVFEHDGRTAAEGRVVAVRCQVRPGGRLEAVAIPADIVARLTTAGPPG